MPTTIDAALAWQPPPGCLARCPTCASIASLGAGVEQLLADPRPARQACRWCGWSIRR